MKVKHIYWFAYFNNTEASVRYRAIYPLKWLEENKGITYHLVIPSYSFSNILHFIKVYFSLLFFRKPNSVIVIQKIYSQGLYASALKFLLLIRKQATVYDTDDAEHTRRPTDTIHFFMRHCQFCSVGSRELLAYVSQFGNKAFLLTSPIIEHQIRKSVKRTEPFTIGWIGYYGAHRKNLEAKIFPALKKLDYPITLKVLGVKNEDEQLELKRQFDSFPFISVDAPLNLDWLDEENIYSQLATFDVGVAPLLDNEFNRSKSAFKLKQCLSVGAPVLACPIGENRYFLKDGENGFLCDGPEQYSMYLNALREAPQSRWNSLSESALDSVKEFGIPAFCEALLQNLENPDLGTK